MSKKINVGIIGCGWIAKKAYMPILKQMNSVTISTVFDSDFQKALEAQNTYCIPNAFNSIKGFISSPLDAVIITTPNNSHTYYTDLALHAGLHVLCEKPVAFLKKDIESSITKMRENKKFFLPALVNRFRKDIIKFSELVPLIGEVIEIEVSWIRKSGIPRPGTWITNKVAAGGGVMIDIGTHVIDIGLTFLSDKRIKSTKMVKGVTNKVKERSAQWNITNESQRFQFDVETWAIGEIVFFNDSILKFNVNWSSDVREDITNIRVVGNDGTININTLFGFSNNFTRESIKILYKRKNGKSETLSFPMKNTFALDAFSDLVKYFINTINGESTSILQPSDGIHVVNVIEKLYQSA